MTGRPPWPAGAGAGSKIDLAAIGTRPIESVAPRGRAAPPRGPIVPQPMSNPALQTAPPTRRPAAFIDRDGVINAELDYVHRIADFHVLPGVFDGLRALAAHGFELVVVTNQAGIAKGLYTEADFQRLTRHMLALFADEGIRVAAVLHCPHHPQAVVREYALECDCRKPAPGMLLRAAAEHGLALERSVMIGDKTSDTDAGRAAGVASTVLVESGHALAADALAHADHRCADLRAAAQWICARPPHRPAD